MLIGFYLHLKARGIPVSITEFLTLLEALGARLAGYSLDDFHLLARLAMVKDEAQFDRYDQAFGEYFRGVEALPGLEAEIPEDWLRLAAGRHLTAEDRATLEKLGFDRLFEQFRQRLAEQKERHSGGSKWIGTGGTSPFGHGGEHPEGIRIGGDSGGHRTAVKVWERREFRNFDDRIELGVRNVKLALRRLRRFARQGAAEELDLDATVAGTARNGGCLDLHLRPERRNAVKILLLLDVGGSMDLHVPQCEELFSAARAEFKHLEHYYFHNCVYESVWRDNRRRHDQRTPTWDLLHTYGPDYKLILVGDASMSPYELDRPGGSVEHWNEEAGTVWLTRLFAAWPKAAWLNPVPEEYWRHGPSIRAIGQAIGGRMFPLTLEGLERAMAALSR